MPAKDNNSTVAECVSPVVTKEAFFAKLAVDCDVQSPAYKQHITAVLQLALMPGAQSLVSFCLCGPDAPRPPYNRGVALVRATDAPDWSTCPIVAYGGAQLTLKAPYSYTIWHLPHEAQNQ